MLSTDTDFELRSSLASAFSSHTNELADALAIENSEGILLENAFGDISGQNLIHIIAGESKGRLREVVRSEGKELSFLGDLVCDKGGAGKLDHSPHQIVDPLSFFSEDFFGHTIHDLRLVRHF